MLAAPQYKLTGNLRLIELFAGYGSQALAFKRAGIPFEHQFVCEFDKYAIQSYNALHGTQYEATNIQNIHADSFNIQDREKFTYFMTYSFPCQSISQAGKRLGMKKGSGTRSGLLWEVERLLTECGENLPQILMMENVPQVVGNKNIDDFNSWLAFLKSKGYSNHYAILNSKDFGVPQNRDRCFMLSFLGDYSFDFPSPVSLSRNFNSMLDSDVDERFYMTNDTAKKFLKSIQESEFTMSNTLQGKVTRIGNIYGPEKGTSFAGNVWNRYGICPTLTTMGGGNRQPLILDKGRLRKVTPRECFRLMGVEESDIDKLMGSGLSASQLYKQAGNSIVVDVMAAIFAKMARG